MNNKIVRSELKYFISKQESIILEKKLNCILEKDYHVKDDGYFIRSIYFDSHEDECLYDKQMGRLDRKKYRLRIYSLSDDNVKFEIKNKVNNQILKETAVISPESAKKIINGNFEELLKYKNPILNRAYVEFSTKHYTPKVVVDYKRVAFKHMLSNFRITIDKNLSSNCTNFDIFSTNFSTLPVQLDGRYILEIKYDRFFPKFIRGLLTSSCQNLAISKYTLTRRFLKTMSWQDN